MTINLQTEGDINFSEEPLEWNDSITQQQTREFLDEDTKYFFHQYMLTPEENHQRFPFYSLVYNGFSLDEVNEAFHFALTKNPFWAGIYID